MIMCVDDLKRQINCGTLTDDIIQLRLESIEAVIRAFTNNRFQNRAVRFAGRSDGLNIYGSPRHFAVGDTVQISESINNDGLTVITAVSDDHITVADPLSTDDHNLVTLVKYPADVRQCAVDLFSWKLSMGDKVGIKSETISRHTVAYEDSQTLFMGFPVGILNGLKLHKKARC